MTAEAARAEACKNSMFPGTALMYWLGTDGLHQLRRQRERVEGQAFNAAALSRSRALVRLDSGAAAGAHLVMRVVPRWLVAAVALAVAVGSGCGRRAGGGARQTIC